MNPAAGGADDDAALGAVRDVGPHAYGWLRLDRRGGWRLRGAPVRHPRVRDYLGEHYQVAATGAWFVQNGAQCVWVSLETAPLIVHLDTHGRWQAHTGLECGAPSRALLDEAGGLWLQTPAGPAWVEEGALEQVADALVDAGGGPLTPEQIEALMAGAGTAAWLRCESSRVPLEPVLREAVPTRLGFVAEPRPPA